MSASPADSRYTSPPELAFVVHNGDQLLRALGQTDVAALRSWVVDRYDDHVRLDGLSEMEASPLLHGGLFGIQLEYPMDVREFWTACEVLEYVDRRDWENERRRPSKRELQLALQHLAERVAEVRDGLDL